MTRRLYLQTKYGQVSVSGELCFSFQYGQQHPLGDFHPCKLSSLIILGTCKGLRSYTEHLLSQVQTPLCAQLTVLIMVSYYNKY